MIPPDIARILGSGRLLLRRAAVAAIFFLAAAWLGPRLGTAPAISLMAGVAFCLCVLTGFKLTHAPQGKISLVHRLAPILLPLGFNIGRGNIRVIVGCSWAGWTAVSAIGALHLVSRLHLISDTTASQSPLLRILAITGVLIDGIAFGYLASMGAKRLTFKSPGVKPMAILLSILLATMITSLWLCGADRPGYAALLSFAPILLTVDFYAGLFLVMKNSRFN